MSSIPYVGIIIPTSIYNKIPMMKENLMRMFSFFEEAGTLNNIRICYFTLSRIKPGNKYVKAYVKVGDQYILRNVPKPKVVYSRVLDHLPKYKAHIDSLVKDGTIIFNRPNYDIEKYTIHQLLVKDDFIKRHLPVSKPLNINTLQTMMKKFDSLILKPNYGERGIGVMKLDWIDKEWRLSYKLNGNNVVHYEFFTDVLPVLLLKRIKRKNYIIQETIPLATYKGNPLDLRVSLQKNRKGQFTVSGIMCKVAKQADFLTNGAQGSTTYRLENIFTETNIRISPNELNDHIHSLTIKIAKHLDQIYPHLADLGFDIGVTSEGIPYFIECNFISDYLGGIFVEGELIASEWQSIFTNPIDYAKYLLEKT